MKLLVLLLFLFQGVSYTICGEGDSESDDENDVQKSAIANYSKNPNGVFPHRCCVGGMVETDCQSLIDGSILKAYVSKFEIPEDYMYEYDIPHRYFQKPIKQSKSIKSLIIGTKTKKDLSKGPGLYLYRLFLNNRDYMSPRNCAVSLGTDVHRVKYHSLMVSKYQLLLDQDYFTMFLEDISSSYYYEHLHFLVSCYNAATTHYFNRNIQLGLDVLKDGLDFISKVLKQKHMGDDDRMKEILVWSILYNTLIIDLMDSAKKADPSNSIGPVTDKWKSMLATDEEALVKLLNGKKYPTPYILSYRKLFLDEGLSTVAKKELRTIAQNNLLTYAKNYKKYHMFSIYYELVASIVETDPIVAFKLLMKAIMSSAKSTEDRLLNYRANQMAKESLNVCINENGWIINSTVDFCNEIRKRQNLELESNPFLNILITKYTREKMYTHIIEMLNVNIANEDDYIHEPLLHIIYTQTINMDPAMRKKNLVILKEGITILNTYITEKVPKSGLQKNPTDPKEKRRIKNAVIAYKWLAEFNALYCTGILDGTECHEKPVTESLNLANNTTTLDSNMPKDLHLEYLTNKLDCITHFHTQTWEKNIKLDGWILKKYKAKIPKTRDACQMVFQSFLKLDHQFIHKADVLTNIYRLRMDDTDDHFKNYILSEYLKNAMSIAVVNCEDRYRNREAHELYSMHLIKFNAAPGRERLSEKSSVSIYF